MTPLSWHEEARSYVEIGMAMHVRTFSSGLIPLDDAYQNQMICVFDIKLF